MNDERMNEKDEEEKIHRRSEDKDTKTISTRFATFINHEIGGSIKQ